MTPRRRTRSLTDVIEQTAPEEPTVPTLAPDRPAVEDPEPLPPVDDTPRKYTMTNTPAEDERAHTVVTDVVRRSGLRPRKPMRADVIRALFAEAEEDPRLRARVAKRLRDGSTA